MTDRKDDYYQPWLRDPAPKPGASAPLHGEGLAKPKDEPPLGIDLTRYDKAETPRRAPLANPEAIGAGATRLWMRIRRGAETFADWTIRVGERADIPARVEAMEIPRRADAFARRTAAAAMRAARAAGRGSARVGRAATKASGDAWAKMALGDKVRTLSSKAGRGVGEVADKAKAGVADIAKAGSEKLRPAPRAESPPPPSGLEQLLAREATAAQAKAPAAPDLPLFAGDAAIPVIAKPEPKATAGPPDGDDRSPLVKASKTRPAGDTTVSAGRLPTWKGTDMERGSMHRWALAGGGILLLATAFWLGGRLGGGLSKSEVETVVADYIKANPQIIPEALQAQRGREIAKAIDAVRPALEKPYAGAWAGNADGDVTLVVFTDYACGFCRASVPDVDRLIREDKRLKVVFRELPIIAPQSRDAAIMALAAARQGKYDAFHHAMFAASSLDPDAIAAAAARAGVVTDGSADATANEALFQREIDSNMAIASQLQLNATPTWIVGDQLLQGQVGYDVLRQAIGKARAAS
ncbi:thioredoxin domain-containing protein [Sphingopyxis sp. LK2115]|uniref:DsbA family protein n=1 Tax=Sphingopyxis sp. LK2115 TaxID=2744558 RepID=UPI00166098AF|nr:thioredoxin domain-containing protein [Sphingopyxis sp. LK2115]